MLYDVIWCYMMLYDVICTELLPATFFIQFYPANGLNGWRLRSKHFRGGKTSVSKRPSRDQSSTGSPCGIDVSPVISNLMCGCSKQLEQSSSAAELSGENIISTESKQKFTHWCSGPIPLDWLCHIILQSECVAYRSPHLKTELQTDHLQPPTSRSAECQLDGRVLPAVPAERPLGPASEAPQFTMAAPRLIPRNDRTFRFTKFFMYWVDNNFPSFFIIDQIYQLSPHIFPSTSYYPSNVHA